MGKSKVFIRTGNIAGENVMDNAIKYYFSDFTYDNYHRLLDLAKSQYKFKFYHDKITNEKSIIWRHDIDHDIENALKIAKIEADKDVKSTYCVLLHNEYYNILNKETGEIIHQISELGHEIGLHFDPDYYNTSDLRQMENILNQDKSILKTVISREVTTFSFYTTTPLTMEAKEHQYCGMINATSAYFRNKYEYCSDSNGYWRFKRLEDILRKTDYKRLHILTHPVWWQKTVMSPKERIYRCIDNRCEYNKAIYRKHIKRFNRKNLDW